MIFEVKANAKINMGLNVTGKLENGYHLLDMIMLPIDFSDNLKIEFSDEDGELEITTNKKEIPTGKENILYKIYDAFYEKTKLKKKRVLVYLEKIIPHEAGLGGGSSDGACFLKVLNEYYNNILTEDEMVELGKKIGADIPFFIINKPARVKGIGEKIEVIENNLKNKIILLKPEFGVSTKEAYRGIKNIEKLKKADIEKIKDDLKKGNENFCGKKIQNNLEEILLKKDKNLVEFKKKLEKIKDVEFFMSGSGSAYFGIVKKSINEEEIIPKIKEIVKKCGVYLCSFK